MVAARKCGLSSDDLEKRLPRVGEVPFSSERKLMSTIHRDTDQEHAGIVFTKGAPDVLLAWKRTPPRSMPFIRTTGSNRVDDPQFVFGVHTCVYRYFGNRLRTRIESQLRQICAGDDAAVFADAKLLSDDHGSAWVVAGDHERSNAGVLGAGP